MAANIKIFVKKTGEDAMPLTATLDDAIGSVTEKLQLNNVSMWLLKTPLNNGTSLRDAGVKYGDTLTAVALNAYWLQQPQQLPGCEKTWQQDLQEVSCSP